MDALKLTFVNGETISFPFSKDSSIAVETPDGVNGTQRGVWGEVTDVEYVAGPVEPAVTVVPVDAPEAGGMSDPSTGADVSSEPAPSEPPTNPDGSETSSGSEGDTPADPLEAVSSDSSETSSSTDSPSSDTSGEAATSDDTTAGTPDQAA